MGRPPTRRRAGRGTVAPAAVSRIVVDGLTVQVTRKPIRHLYVRVRDDGVEVSAPLRLGQARVEEAVAARRGWIEAQRTRLAARRVDEERRRQAGQVLLWGQPVAVADDRVGRWSVGRDEAGLVVIAPAGATSQGRRAALDRWLRRELEDVLAACLEHWQARLGVRPSAHRVRAMTSRWGSCQPRTGRLTFNAALVQEKPALVEYVVVHELVHLLHAGHGPDFQAAMSRCLPDWRARRAALNRGRAVVGGDA